jgi:hypothetical protein
MAPASLTQDFRELLAAQPVRPTGCQRIQLERLMRIRDNPQIRKQWADLRLRKEIRWQLRADRHLADAQGASHVITFGVAATEDGEVRGGRALINGSCDRGCNSVSFGLW